jgi:L-rhamnose isomerase
MYGEFGDRRVDRDAIGPEHFAGWAAFAAERRLLLDFNATCFSHERAASGTTLASRDPGTRAFWIEHVRRCRQIAAHFGLGQGAPALHNLWIPDGAKEAPEDRLGIRATLRESLDAIYAVRHDPVHLLDSVESKLFGLGSESFVAGSHEFYLAYALSRGLLVCFDTGHFHPTESVADKLSAWLAFAPAVLLHVSRGVRWDSDHVPLFDDAVRELMTEAVRCGLHRVHIALDFFDASLPRAGALALGARAVQKALLFALLRPAADPLAPEAGDDAFRHLALVEALSTMPFGAVWARFCEEHAVPPALWPRPAV